MAASPELAPAPTADAMQPRPFVVRRAPRETGDTFTLSLEPAAAGSVAFFSASIAFFRDAEG